MTRQPSPGDAHDHICLGIDPGTIAMLFGDLMNTYGFVDADRDVAGCGSTSETHGRLPP
jgi:hypothetical protein